MNTTIKRFSLVLVCFFVLGIMVSCVGSNSSSSSDNVKISTDDLYDAAIEGIELPMLQKASPSEINTLMGLSSSDYDEATLYLSMMNVKATEIALFKFSDKTQEDAISKAIDKRLKDLENTWSTYLPDQYDLVKGVKKISKGNLKGYVIDENADDIIKNINNKIK